MFFWGKVKMRAADQAAIAERERLLSLLARSEVAAAKLVDAFDVLTATVQRQAKIIERYLEPAPIASRAHESVFDEDRAAIQADPTLRKANDE